MLPSRRVNEIVPIVMKLFETLIYKVDTMHRQISRLREHSYLTFRGLPMSGGRCLAAIGSMSDFSVLVSNWPLLSVILTGRVPVSQAGQIFPANA